MILSYVKLIDEVRVNGKMVLELHGATASAIGVVAPSESGAVLVPWHNVRWAVRALDAGDARTAASFAMPDGAQVPVVEHPPRDYPQVAITKKKRTRKP